MTDSVRVAHFICSVCSVLHGCGQLIRCEIVRKFESLQEVPKNLQETKAGGAFRQVIVSFCCCCWPWCSQLHKMVAIFLFLSLSPFFFSFFFLLNSILTTIYFGLSCSTLLGVLLSLLWAPASFCASEAKAVLSWLVFCMFCFVASCDWRAFIPKRAKGNLNVSIC